MYMRPILRESVLRNIFHKWNIIIFKHSVHIYSDVQAKIKTHKLINEYSKIAWSRRQHIFYLGWSNKTIKQY